MVKHTHSNYLIEKIRTLGKSDPSLEIQDFRLALYEIYLSRDSKKIGELANTLARSCFKEEKLKDYLIAFEKSLMSLTYFSKIADEFYEFKNSEIQEFYKDSIEDVCKNFN